MKNKNFYTVNRSPLPLWKVLFYLGIALGGIVFVRAVLGVINHLS